MPHFETFKKSLVPLSHHPHLTVQKRGTITINQAAYVALGSPEAVELLYDRDEHILGLRTVAPDVPHASFVRLSSTKSANGPYVISAMAFIKFYGIDNTESRRWPATMDHKILCVQLTSQSQTVSKERICE